MRIVSAVVAASFFAVSSYGAVAGSPTPVQGLKSSSGFELIKSSKKSTKKAKTSKKGKKSA